MERIEDFLSNDAFVMTNKRLIKLLGLGEAVFLQELISQRKRFKQSEFYFTQNDMEKELGISVKTQQRYANNLKNKGLIDFQRKGIPARNYYTINDEAIINLFQNGKTSSDNLTELVQSEGPDYSYISNNTINKSLNGDSESNRKSTKQKKEKIGKNWSGELTFSENVIEWLKKYDNSRDRKIELLTKDGFWLMIDKLKKLGHGTDEGMIAVLQQSIMNGWEGLFEVKGFKPKVNYNEDLGAFLNRMKTDYEGLKNELGTEEFFRLKKLALTYGAENKLL